MPRKNEPVTADSNVITILTLEAHANILFLVAVQPKLIMYYYFSSIRKTKHSQFHKYVSTHNLLSEGKQTNFLNWREALFLHSGLYLLFLTEAFLAASFSTFLQLTRAVLLQLISFHSISFISFHSWDRTGLIHVTKDFPSMLSPVCVWR